VSGVVKRGYKQTEVGVIPEDWEVKSLGAVSTIQTGNTPPTSDTRNYGDEFLFAGPGDLGEQKFVRHTQKLLSRRGFERARRFPPHSVLFVCIGSTIGKCGVAAVELASNQQINAILPPANHSSDFVYYAVCAAGPRVRRQAGEQAVPLVNKTQFASTLVALPPLPEQRAIADALSDVDALLGALDRLIAKKCELKQAAMQQLLTGQTRLPGFRGEWEVTSVGALGAWFSGGTPSKSSVAFWSGSIPWVSPKDMKRLRISDAQDHVSESALGRGTRLLPRGALMIVVRGMILAHSAPVARAEEPVAFNQDIKGLVTRPDANSEFILWWLVANEHLLLSKTNESTHGTKRIPTEGLFELEVLLPQPDEQTAIASVLSEMDAELTALTQRREKTQALKQGMMQELLTGRTRLLPARDAHG
jgi:type I restriction enzyme S subunit